MVTKLLRFFSYHQLRRIRVIENTLKAGGQLQLYFGHVNMES